ncbi:MAG: hypothetical protein NVS1B13_20070 [Flavisolibacter sp.]
MKLFIFLAIGLVLQILHAQETSPYIKFGKIKVADLEKKFYSIDSSANAVVLSDMGDAAVKGNTKGWFSISFTRHRVVHILNKNGYDEANVEVRLYNRGSGEERLENLQAVTYNLENGVIVTTKLEKSNIFKEKLDEHWSLKKFTMPSVKAGSIIEFQYTVFSDYLENLDPWVFQGSSPELWSEYQLSVPQFFSYVMVSHGFQPFFIQDKKDRQDNFTIVDSRGVEASEHYSFTSGVSDFRWVMKNVPELKEESYTASVKNHLARMEFQLSSQNYPLSPHDFRNTWPSLTKELLTSDYFGHTLNNNNNWLSDELKPLMIGAGSEVEKARNVYDFVRDNYTCTGHSGIYADQSLKNVMKTKKGNVAEINLLLTAMLRYVGLKADPFIISTRDHGYPVDLYPMLSNFNYVLTRFSSGGQYYYLDASHPRLGFAKILPQCYNGGGRLINEDALHVSLSTDSIKEGKTTFIFISNSEDGKWGGTMKQNLGYYESYNLRDQVKQKGKEEFEKDLQKQYGADVKVQQLEIDSFQKYEYPVCLRYNLELNPGSEDIFYFNPMFGEAYKKNPFKSAERLYPVEMPYASDETFVITMELPKGYVVDELPKQIVAKLDEKGSAMFEYRLTQSGNTISLRSRLKFSRTLFLPDEYENLREFFNLVVTNQNQHIVFKKQK